VMVVGTTVARAAIMVVGTGEDHEDD
jgi:hypothetical protein